MTIASTEQIIDGGKTMSDIKELSDKQLSAVTGGTGTGEPAAKYEVGQHLWEYFNATMNYYELEIVRITGYSETYGYYYGVRRLDDGTYSLRYLETLTYIYDYDPRVV